MYELPAAVAAVGSSGSGQPNIACDGSMATDKLSRGCAEALSMLCHAEAALTAW